MAFADKKNNARQAWSVTGVVIVHVAIGYAFVVGLANHFTKRVWDPIVTYPVPPKVPPPPTEPKQTKPQTPATVPTRIVDTGADSKTPLLSTVDDPPPVKTTPADPPPPPITILKRGVQVKGDRASWVTTEDYPSESIRNGEEGRVEITVMVGTNGRVTSCKVTRSSNYVALDQATCRFYAKRARFTPALAEDGTPVEASYVDRVRWQLPAQ